VDRQAGRARRDEAGRWPGPPPGLLSFFCWQDPETSEVTDARVIVTPQGAALQRVAASTAREDALPEFAATIRSELTVPAVGVTPSVRLQPFGFDYDEPRYEQHDDYFAFVDALASEHGFDGPRHQLLGHPEHIQNDILVTLAGEAIRASYEELEAESLNWRLLLQVESDRRFGDSFADGGSIYFGIRAEDLAAGRFDRVTAAMDTG
jgi:Domain of unknown function (DUF1963)